MAALAGTTEAPEAASASTDAANTRPRGGRFPESDTESLHPITFPLGALPVPSTVEALMTAWKDEPRAHCDKSMAEPTTTLAFAQHTLISFYNEAVQDRINRIDTEVQGLPKGQRKAEEGQAAICE